MNNQPQHTIQAPGLTLSDVYFVLFRHKWKIIVFSLAGFALAATLYLFQSRTYQSEAELYIRYVLDTHAPKSGMGDDRTTSPDERGDNIMNSEVAILSSLDLAQTVASNIGPEKILAKVGGGKDPVRAAGVLRGNLLVQAGKQSSIITVILKHPDPDILQPVLQNLIDEYLNKHREIHQAAGMSYEALDAETGQLRTRLSQTDEELKKKTGQVGAITPQTTKIEYANKIARIQDELLDAQVKLAQQQASLASLTNHSSHASENPATTNSQKSAAVADIPPTKSDDYKNTCDQIDQLWKKKTELLNQSYREESKPVKEVVDEISDAESHKQKLEAEYPGLAASPVVTSSHSEQPGASALNLSGAIATVEGLEATTNLLASKLAQIQAGAAQFAEAEPAIMELQRTKQIDETNYLYFKTTLEQSRINEVLGDGKVSNISIIQKPSPPGLAQSKLMRLVGMVGIAGIALGLGLAFLIEFYLDRSLKRPVEIETKLKLPLFVSIPCLDSKSRNWLGNILERRLLKNGNGATSDGHGENGHSATPAQLEVAPWAEGHSLHSFYEALRDRLVTYFELKNLTHKPKLVAITSSGKGSGVTTTAMGLAASLSQTGEGNVLLVDMNIGQEAAQQFHRGKPVCGLDEILEDGNRTNALVQDNLYVVADSSTNGDKLSRIFPKRFGNMLPKLRASDYDYIIFDMPPVSQISITPRLSRFMDMILFVVEAEKTDSEVARRATALLVEASGSVGIVLNKTRTYIPRALQQDF
jgi:uncharacterized protein involved in exopolysaccharide biosynthesis/Mrp family chromosome partitioning ATPase